MCAFYCFIIRRGTHLASFHGSNFFRVSPASVLGPSPLPNALKVVLAVMTAWVFAITVELTPREIPPPEPPDREAVRRSPLFPSLLAPPRNVYRAGVATNSGPTPPVKVVWPFDLQDATSIPIFSADTKTVRSYDRLRQHLWVETLHHHHVKGYVNVS